MSNKMTIFSSSLAISLLGVALCIGQSHPQLDSNTNKTDIEAAHLLTGQAIQRLEEADSLKEDDSQGHAKKAKKLLNEALRELEKAKSSNHI